MDRYDFREDGAGDTSDDAAVGVAHEGGLGAH